MAEAQEMEVAISGAMRARLNDFKEQADSLTLEGVRRVLEKDLGLKKLALDVHKRFIKKCLEECFASTNDEIAPKNTDANVEETVQSEQKEILEKSKDFQSQNEDIQLSTKDKEETEGSPILVGKGKSEQETEESVSDRTVSEDAIKKAVKKRATYFRGHSETITLVRVRRLLEEDLELEKNVLDPYKSLINEALDEVLHSEVEPTCDTKKNGLQQTSDGSNREGSSDSEHSNESSNKDEGEEEQIKPKKRKIASKQKTKDNEGLRKRKRSEEENKKSTQKKPVKSGTVKIDDSDEDGRSQSSAEEGLKKKREVSTQVHGKQVENLKSVIKACGMNVPPSVYKRAKQAPESKREAYLIKDLEEILSKEGLSTNPSEKEIKMVRKTKERAKELEGIDMSNIVSSSRRRSTFSFSMPAPAPAPAPAPTPKPKTPKPKTPNESGEDEDEDENEDEEEEEVDEEEGDEESEDEDSESEASSEEFNEEGDDESE